MSLVETMKVSPTAGRVARHRPICPQLSGWRGVVAHPDAPAGGCGHGFSRSPQLLGYEAGCSHPYAPAGRFSPCAHKQANVEIEFGPNAKRSAVSNYTLQVLEHILQAAGESSATITSTARSARDQARAMFSNPEKYGVARRVCFQLFASSEGRCVYMKARTKNEAIRETMPDVRTLTH
jgi:hypothetical protein